MIEKTIIPEKLNLALNNLAEKVKFSEPVNNYQTTLEQFTQDAESQKIMKDLSAVQKVVRQKQGSNQITQQDLQELRTLQSKAQENQVISSYANSQQEAIAHLREINVEISSLLGVDFASLAKKSGCC